MKQFGILIVASIATFALIVLAPSRPDRTDADGALVSSEITAPRVHDVQQVDAEPTRANATIVAWANGVAIFDADLRAHVPRLQPSLALMAEDERRDAALDAAIRVKLLTQEARRRGIAAPSGPLNLVEAHLVRGLLKLTARGTETGGESIADSEALTFFNQHGTLFETVEFVRLAAIVVSDEDRAERLLGLAINASEPEFRQLVERYSEDSASKRRNGQFLLIDERLEHSPGTVPHSDPGEREITPVAMALRHVGDVGLARGPNGTFYVLRATELRMHRPIWDTALLQRVRTIMAWNRQETAISELEQRLRQAARVQVNENVLRSINIPVPGGVDTVDPSIHVND